MSSRLAATAFNSLKLPVRHWKVTILRTSFPSEPRQLLFRTVVLRKFHRSTSAASLVINQTPVFAKAPTFGDKIAIIDSSGRHSYEQLYCSSYDLASRISAALNSDFGGLEGKRVAFLCANDVSYTVAQWAAWMSGGTAVPLYRKHPVAELEYIISDSQSSLLVAGHPYAEIIEPLAVKLGLPYLTLPPSSTLSTVKETDAKERKTAIADWADRPAMIIYTSGTTGRPKGVLHTHSSILAMVRFLL